MDGEAGLDRRILAAVTRRGRRLAGGETASASLYSALRLWGLTDYSLRSVHVEVAHATTRRRPASPATGPGAACRPP